MLKKEIKPVNLPLRYPMCLLILLKKNIPRFAPRYIFVIAPR